MSTNTSQERLINRLSMQAIVQRDHHVTTTWSTVHQSAYSTQPAASIDHRWHGHGVIFITILIMLCVKVGLQPSPCTEPPGLSALWVLQPCRSPWRYHHCARPYIKAPAAASASVRWRMRWIFVIVVGVMMNVDDESGVRGVRRYEHDHRGTSSTGSQVSTCMSPWTHTPRSSNIYVSRAQVPLYGFSHRRIARPTVPSPSEGPSSDERSVADDNSVSRAPGRRMSDDTAPTIAA